MKRVLIIKLSALGDIAKALTMVAYIKKQHPHCFITWVCLQCYLPLLNCVKDIDELIGVSSSLLYGNRWQKIGAILGTWRRLAGRSFDKVLIGHGDPRYRLLTCFVRSANKRFFSRHSRQAMRPIPGRYQGDDYLRLIDDQAGPIPYTAADNFPLLEVEKRPEYEGSIVLVPGGATNLWGEGSQRKWPLPYYKDLAVNLGALGFKVVIVGGKDEHWISHAFQSLAVEDLVGKTDLPSLAAVLKSARLVISHDTGALHIARLVHTPVVGLFGPTLAQEMGGKNKKNIFLWKGEGLACAPCYDGKRYARCTRNLCMEAISVEDVMHAIKAMV